MLLGIAPQKLRHMKDMENLKHILNLVPNKAASLLSLKIIVREENESSLESAFFIASSPYNRAWQRNSTQGPSLPRRRRQCGGLLLPLHVLQCHQCLGLLVPLPLLPGE